MIKTSGFKVYKVQSRLKYCYWDESVLWREKATGGNIVAIPAFDVIHRSIKRRLWNSGFEYPRFDTVKDQKR
jgi:hypothetical protein